MKKYKFILIILCQCLWLYSCAQKNESIIDIPPNIVEPMPFYVGVGDTLYIRDLNISSDSLYGKVWINLLLDSLGNKLSFAIIAFDNYISNKRMGYIQYTAFDIYVEKMNYLDIYSKEMVRIYPYIEKFIKEIHIMKTGQLMPEKYYSLSFYLYINPHEEFK